MFDKFLIAYYVIGVLFMNYKVYGKPSHKRKGAGAKKIKNGEFQYSPFYISLWPIILIVLI